MVSWASPAATHDPPLPLAPPPSCPFQEQTSPTSTRSSHLTQCAPWWPLCAPLAWGFSKELGRGWGSQNLLGGHCGVSGLTGAGRVTSLLLHDISPYRLLDFPGG